MTVICTNHREEIEGAINFNDNDLIITQNYDINGLDCGPFELWHHRWIDPGCEDIFVKEDALKLGLDECYCIEEEEDVWPWVVNYVAREAINGYTRDLVDSDELQNAFDSLAWLSVSEGYVRFPDFVLRFLCRCKEAALPDPADILRATPTLSLARASTRQCYLLAALSDELDDLVVRLLDPPIEVRETRIPSVEQIIEGLSVPPPLDLRFYYDGN